VVYFSNVICENIDMKALVVIGYVNFVTSLCAVLILTIIIDL
jgi:hypothetical protein